MTSLIVLTILIIITTILIILIILIINDEAMEIHERRRFSNIIVRCCKFQCYVDLFNNKIVSLLLLLLTNWFSDFFGVLCFHYVILLTAINIEIYNANIDNGWKCFLHKTNKQVKKQTNKLINK